MKKILFAIALAVVATACNKDVESTSATTDRGTLAVRLTASTEVGDTTNEQNKTVVACPANEQFNLSIADTATGVKIYEGALGEYDATTLIPSGDKSIRIWFGDINDEGYDKPYFEGAATATVQSYGLSAEAMVEVGVANAAIAIETTELFDSYFQSATFTVVTENCTEGHAFDTTAEGLLFVAPAEVTVKCLAVGPTGTKYEFSQRTPALQPQRRNIVRFDMKSAGNVVVNIEFNNQLVGSELIEVELNDKA
ncbi:MAG: DUF4493 domain-containing protein [Alistipes sp.]|nr:DUF4493 domain-containing protein [Alistipes sp.]